MSVENKSEKRSMLLFSFLLGVALTRSLVSCASFSLDTKPVSSTNTKLNEDSKGVPCFKNNSLKDLEEYIKEYLSHTLTELTDRKELRNLIDNFEVKIEDGNDYFDIPGKIQTGAGRIKSKDDKYIESSSSSTSVLESYNESSKTSNLDDKSNVAASVPFDKGETKSYIDDLDSMYSRLDTQDVSHITDIKGQPLGKHLEMNTKIVSDNDDMIDLMISSIKIPDNSSTYQAHQNNFDQDKVSVFDSPSSRRETGKKTSEYENKSNTYTASKQETGKASNVIDTELGNDYIALMNGNPENLKIESINNEIENINNDAQFFVEDLKKHEKNNLQQNSQSLVGIIKEDPENEKDAVLYILPTQKDANETNDKTKSSSSNMTHGKTTKTHTISSNSMTDMKNSVKTEQKSRSQETEGSDYFGLSEKLHIGAGRIDKGSSSSNTSSQKTHSKSTKDMANFIITNQSNGFVKADGSGKNRIGARKIEKESSSSKKTAPATQIKHKISKSTKSRAASSKTKSRPGRKTDNSAKYSGNRGRAKSMKLRKKKMDSNKTSAKSSKSKDNQERY